MPTQYTELEGERRFKQVDWGRGPFPPCQASMMTAEVPKCDKPGEFDSPTTEGPWADLCRRHAELFCPKSSSIGFHRIRHESS